MVAQLKSTAPSYSVEKLYRNSLNSYCTDLEGLFTLDAWLYCQYVHDWAEQGYTINLGESGYELTHYTGESVLVEYWYLLFCLAQYQ